jgi:hypothetical protein
VLTAARRLLQGHVQGKQHGIYYHSKRKTKFWGLCRSWLYACMHTYIHSVFIHDQVLGPLQIMAQRDEIVVKESPVMDDIGVLIYV